MIKEVIPAGEKQVSLQRQIGELLNELKDIFQGIYLIKVRESNHFAPSISSVTMMDERRSP